MPCIVFMSSKSDLVLIYLFAATDFLKVSPCGLVMPYGNKDLFQHYCSLWLVPWWRQAIIWTSVALSSIGSCAIQLNAITLGILIMIMHLQIGNLKSKQHPPDTNDLSSVHDAYWSRLLYVICWGWAGTCLGRLTVIRSCILFTGFHEWQP